MTRLVWGETGTRLYRAGVDRGVLFVDGVGFVWNGLTSVEESPSGGDAQPYYQDGIKQMNVSSQEEFEATISAFYSPPEFDECDGTLELAPGLFASQQNRKPFGFAYRNKIGNDLLAVDHGYKIHFIYNATAAPTSTPHVTIAGDTSVDALSWAVATVPVPITDALPSAHVEVDSTRVSKTALEMIESILYGSDADYPRLPYPDEIASIINNYQDPIIVDNGDGSFSITASDNVLQLNSATGEFVLTAASVAESADQSYTISYQ